MTVLSPSSLHGSCRLAGPEYTAQLPFHCFYILFSYCYPLTVIPSIFFFRYLKMLFLTLVVASQAIACPINPFYSLHFYLYSISLYFYLHSHCPYSVSTRYTLVTAAQPISSSFPDPYCCKIIFF